MIYQWLKPFLKKYFSTRPSIVTLHLLISLTNHPYASLKDEPLTGNNSPDSVLYINALLDLCVAYDYGPFYVSKRLLRVHSFVRSIPKAEAGDTPLGACVCTVE